MSKDISQNIISLADKMEDHIVFGENGVAVVPAETYKDLLPEGVSEELYMKVMDHNVDFATAGVRALGRKSIPHMQANPDITQTSLAVPAFGKDRFNFTFTKERPVPSKNEDGVVGTKSSYGTAAASFDQYGLGKRGDMAKVKAMLVEQATEAFGGAAAEVKAA